MMAHQRLPQKAADALVKRSGDEMDSFANERKSRSALRLELQPPSLGQCVRKSTNGRPTPTHAAMIDPPRSQRHAKQIRYDHHVKWYEKVVKEYKCVEKAASQIDANPRRLGTDVGIAAINST